MCGLVGAFGNIYHKEKNAFKWLLYFDVIRGPHSTGIAAIKVDKDERKYTVMKEVGEPIFLYDKYKEEFDKDDIIKGLDTKALIGHNRWATSGAVTQENAHPFEFDNIIGAHNGTVKMESLKDFVGYKDFKVDSQIIFAELDANKDIDNIWKNVDGAMALTWWDKEDETINLVRNKERPLHFVYTKDNRTVFWASEAWMLMVVLNKCNIDTHDILSVPENKLLTFKKDGFKEIERIEKDLIPFVPPPITSTHFLGHGGGTNYNRYQQKHLARIVEFSPANSFNESFFVGIDEEGDEIIIKMPFHEDLAKKAVISINENLNKNRPYYEYPEYATYWRDGYNLVGFASITHKKNMLSKTSINNKKEEEEDVEDKTRQVLSHDGEVITRAQWKQLEQNCVVCNSKIRWKDAHKVFWIDQDFCACDECKDTEWVHEWAGHQHDRLVY